MADTSVGAVPAASQPAPIASAPAPVAAPEAIQPEAGRPDQRFVFGGVEFDSEAAADHSYRTLRGQYQGINRRLADLGQENAQLRSLVETYNTLATSAQPATPAAPVNPTDAWGEFSQIRAQRGEADALRWIVDNLRSKPTDFDAAVQTAVDARLEGFYAQQQQQAVVTQLDSVASELSHETLASGEPAYPELRDERQMYAVGDYWRRLGFNPSVGATKGGLKAAISLYRQAAYDARAAHQARSTPAPVSPAAVAASASNLRSTALSNVASERERAITALLGSVTRNATTGVTVTPR